jgi:hypothetical protein
MHHYGKIRRCRAAFHCREALHGKDFFAVWRERDARQRNKARQSFMVAHGKVSPHGKVRSASRQRVGARQSPPEAHGKEARTAKILCRALHSLPCVAFFAVVLPLPCGQE